MKSKQNVNTTEIIQHKRAKILQKFALNEIYQHLTAIEQAQMQSRF